MNKQSLTQRGLPPLMTAVLATTTAGISLPLAAQDGLVLEEIVVTAQRREQNLQEVPISVTAFSGAELEQNNITSAADYLSLTPNVSFTEDGQTGSRGISLSVRGITNLVSGENAFINSIGNYIDEFSVSSVPNAVLNPQLADVARIEVLRGPQGTLFGRNSVGGALNITTNDPVDEFGGKITVEYQDFDDAGEQAGITGMLNLPISDNFLTRGVIRYEDSSGYVENITDRGADDSGHEALMLRFKALWTPSDRTTAKLTLIYSDEEQDTDETVPSGVLDIDTVDTLSLAPENGSGAVDPGTGFWPNNRNQLSHDLQEENINQSTLAIVNISHELSDTMVLKWITGYLDAENERVFDNDLVGNADALQRDNEYEGTSWSTEVRLEMTEDSFDLVAGLLYAEDEQDQINRITVGTEPTADLDPDPNTVVGIFPPFPTGLCLQCNKKNFEVQSVAAFADLTWHATDRFDVGVGGRLTRDKVTDGRSDVTSLAGAPPDFPGFTNTFRQDAEKERTFDDFSPRLTARYQVSDDLNVYGTISKGYKGGGTSIGHDTNIEGEPAIFAEFDEETLWNYELGFKSELLDRRLRVNASLFYLQWSDLIVESFRLLTSGNLSSNFEQAINVEEAEALGFEAEFISVVTEGFTLAGSIGLLDTEITSADPTILTGGYVVDLEGLDLPKAPELTASLSGEYRWPIGDNELWVRLEYIHRDGQFSDIEGLTYRQTRGPSPNAGLTPPAINGGFPYRSPDYDLVNLRAGFGMEQFEFGLFVENLTDEEYYTGTQENFGVSGIRLRPHPLIIGASASFSF